MTRAFALGFNRRLFRWHRSRRRDIAIRSERDAWRILVAEVMSQQTTIARVGDYWSRFVTTWPTADSLAEAGTPELLQAWAGLGYNRRALALRECARSIVSLHGGRVPRSVAALERLPGVGLYTARAVAASAFRQPVAPMDTNVTRVCVRVLGPVSGSLQEACDQLVARGDPRRWMDAVMDLASDVCLARAPRCPECPLSAICATRGAGAKPADKAVGEPFAGTRRWLRGRVLAQAREANGWSELPSSMGSHGAEAISAAARSLEREGFIEIAELSIRMRP